jgi:hypothetical protein
MKDRHVLQGGLSEKDGPHDLDSSPDDEKFDELRRGQVLSVRRACDKFLESRGLKQLPFGTFVLKKTRNKHEAER